MSDFPLIYIERSTGKQYEGKRVTANNYRVRDPDTGVVESLDGRKIKDRFSSHKKNLEHRKKIFKQFVTGPRQI